MSGPSGTLGIWLSLALALGSAGVPGTTATARLLTGTLRASPTTACTAPSARSAAAVACRAGLQPWASAAVGVEVQTAGEGGTRTGRAPGGPNDLSGSTAHGPGLDVSDARRSHLTGAASRTARLVGRVHSGQADLPPPLS